jgi:predicted DNA-binding mobile mystery protein A
MPTDYRALRRDQLDRSLAPFISASAEPRPQRGWLQAIREALGFSLERVAKKMGTSRARILEFERAEKNDRITLQSLRRVAEAMDCKLVYAIVPMSGTTTDLAERYARERATADVREAGNTMALEDQSVNNLDRVIDQQTKARSKR